jgi:hypothetical protein
MTDSVSRETAAIPQKTGKPSKVFNSLQHKELSHEFLQRKVTLSRHCTAVLPGNPLRIHADRFSGYYVIARSLLKYVRS